jgi:hypothetical protein
VLARNAPNNNASISILPIVALDCTVRRRFHSVTRLHQVDCDCDALPFTLFGFNMPPKTVEEQLAELEMEAEAPAPPPKKATKAPRQRFEQDTDALKELEELEALEKFQRPEVARPSSRPNTPKLSSSSTTSSNRRTAGVVTPSSSSSARTSEDKAAAPRKSGESTRSFHQSFAPTEEEPAKPAPPPTEAKQAGGSWWGGGWGGIISSATEAANAAKKQAEAAYQEIQKNQEAQRWADQVRGNVGALRGIGRCTMQSKHCLYANTLQEVNSGNVPFQPSPTSSKPLRRPSHNMNVSRSTSHMTSLVTPPSIPSSTKPSRLLWRKWRAEI